MRKAEKSKLYELVEPLDFNCFVPPNEFVYVIDGGLLLHRLKINKKISLKKYAMIFTSILYTTMVKTLLLYSMDILMMEQNQQKGFDGVKRSRLMHIK